MPEHRPPREDPRKYLRLAALLRDDIRAGTLRPGDRVPSITDLAVLHGGMARRSDGARTARRGCCGSSRRTC